MQFGGLEMKGLEIENVCRLCFQQCWLVKEKNKWKRGLHNHGGKGFILIYYYEKHLSKVKFREGERGKRHEKEKYAR